MSDSDAYTVVYYYITVFLYRYLHMLEKGFYASSF